MKKIILSFALLIVGVSSIVLGQSEFNGSLNPNINNGLEVWLPCSPSSVNNGSVNPATCAITCNNGYSLQWQQCIQQSGGWGWGGGWATPDYCPNGDLSGDFYDRECGTPSIGWWTGTISGSGTISPNGSRSWTPFGWDGSCSDPEYNLAYSFAFHYGITTMPTCLAADMDGWLIRSHAAKMMSNYAMNVLGKTPDTSKVCIFGDMEAETLEMKTYAITACQLWLMGLEVDGVTPAANFNPGALLNKAMFATILSRLMYGNIHDGNDTCWYCNHVEAMVEEGIITVTTDLLDPFRRAYAMIMLMRTQEE